MARETLTREKIVQTAIELLDNEGLDGLRMRSLGERLDSAATAVYWHVKSKDDLLILAADELWHEVKLPDPDTVNWRSAATNMAKDQYAMLTRHPWLGQAMGSHVLYGPNKARHDDHNLAIYETAGFVGAAADQAVAIVFMFVLGAAFGASASTSLRAQMRRRDSEGQRRIRESVEQQKQIAMQFPRLRARMELLDGADHYAVPEKSLEFGLEAVLNGLERQLGMARASAANDERNRLT